MDTREGCSNGTVAAICSNLAKASEKQMRPEVSAQFSKLGTYFDSVREPVVADSFGSLHSLIDADLSAGYPSVEAAATEVQDRGALRCITWGKKVTMIHKSLLGRYEKQGDALLEGNKLFVCEACGFIALSKAVPDLCPICKAPSSRFITVS